jgi:hypothetical protein
MFARLQKLINDTPEQIEKNFRRSKKCGDKNPCFLGEFDIERARNARKSSKNARKAGRNNSNSLKNCGISRIEDTWVRRLCIVPQRSPQSHVRTTGVPTSMLMAFVFSIHCLGVRRKLLSPARFLNPSNSTGLKSGLLHPQSHARTTGVPTSTPNRRAALSPTMANSNRPFEPITAHSVPESWLP